MTIMRDHHRHRRERSASGGGSEMAAVMFLEEVDGDHNHRVGHVHGGSTRRITSDSTWSLAGVDSGKFEILNRRPYLRGQARLRSVWGREQGQRVRSNGGGHRRSMGNRGTKDVKVTVENQERGPGVVTLSKNNPRVGIAVRASLTDPDGSVSGLTWLWMSTTPSTERTSLGTPSQDANCGLLTRLSRAMHSHQATTLTCDCRCYTDGHGPMTRP